MAKGFFRSLLRPAAGGALVQRGRTKTTPTVAQQVTQAVPDRAATRDAPPPPVDPSSGAAELAGEAAPEPPRLYPMTPERPAVIDEMLRHRARLLETVPEATRQKLVAAGQRLYPAQNRG